MKATWPNRVTKWQIQGPPSKKGTRRDFNPASLRSYPLYPTCPPQGMYLRLGTGLVLAQLDK